MKKLGNNAQLVSEYTHAVTHLVAVVDADRRAPRTTKYLSAVLEGKWIVSLIVSYRLRTCGMRACVYVCMCMHAHVYVCASVNRN